MLSVREAQERVADITERGPVVSLFLPEAVGRVSAGEVTTPLDSPLFSNSAMDGFALRCEETLGADNEPIFLKVVGLIAAGEVPKRSLQKGEAIQIMTGAMIPEGADGVIPQENVEEREGYIAIREVVEKQAHVRLKGEEIRQGDALLKRGVVVTPGVVGLLASLGISEVPVFRSPHVSVLPTGSELVSRIEELKEGKIIESNSVTLCSALRELHIMPTVFSPVPDEKKVLETAVEKALETSDFILITGGVSVGKFDFVKEVLKEKGVECCFWKVAQKPGKPIYFGKLKNKYIFGLPGNPASSLVCYYAYVRPAILKYMGHRNIFLDKKTGFLEKSFQKTGSRAHWVRAAVKTINGRREVTPCVGQESHKMSAFAEANALMFVDGDVSFIAKGENVEVHLLPSLQQGGV